MSEREEKKSGTEEAEGAWVFHEGETHRKDSLHIRLGENVNCLCVLLLCDMSNRKEALHGGDQGSDSGCTCLGN